MKVSAGAIFLTLLYFLIYLIGFIGETYYINAPVKHLWFGKHTYSYFLTGVATLGMGISVTCIAVVLLYCIWGFLHLVGNGLVSVLERKNS